MNPPKTVSYRRATFATQLPAGHLYTPSHGWLARQDGGRWRVGYTKFALRMLGELVEVQFTAEAGSRVEPGDILGSIEGFKALSDIYCVGSGTFAGSNPVLVESLDEAMARPYETGWLYEFEGEPDARCLHVEAYGALLDATIDRLLEQQKTDESTT